MEIVRKKISLEKCRSRVNGGIPYIPYNEPFEWKTYIESASTTYGNFASDIDENEDLCRTILGIDGISENIKTDSVIRTCTLFSWYNKLLEILRNGIHLKHTKDVLCPTGTTYSKTYFENFEYDGTTYEFLRSSAVTVYSGTIEDFTVVDEGIYTCDAEIDTDYVIIVDDYNEFIKLGGRDLINIVDGLIDVRVELNKKVVPYLPIHVLLTSDEDDLGVMTPYMDENIDNMSGLTPQRVSSDTIQAESKLQTLKCKKYAVTDNGVILNGCLSYEDMVKLISNIPITTVNLELPFEIGVVVNKDTSNGAYTGDYLSAISIDDEEYSITFVYYIGSFFSNSEYTTVTKEGIKYEETYQFEYISQELEEDSIYGVSGITCNYLNVKYDESKVTVYNEDFNLYRNVNVGNITEFNAADVWTRESAINTPLFKEEYLMGVSSDANIDLNVVIERGAATAFEKHLILGECNTYDDLVNYRNGMFLEK